MKTSSLALLIGSAVAVIAGGTALGITYARFQKAQKEAINGSTTIGDMLAAKPEQPSLTVVPDESEKEVDENESTDNSSDESN